MRIREFVVAGIMLGLAAAAQADVLRVPKDFETIQGAVNAAGEGDVIKVKKGRYTERVVVAGKSGLTIQGQGKVTIDGGGAGPAIRVVDSSRISLLKLTATGGGSETLHLLRSTDCVVTKCRVQDVGGRALLVQAGGGHEISKNRLSGNSGANIDLDSDFGTNPTGCTVVKNRISGGFVGVELQGTGHVVQKNKVKATTGFGIQTFQGGEMLIEKNKLTKVGGVGIRLRGTQIDVIRNTIKKCGGDAIYVGAPGTGVLVERNKMTKPGEDGIDTDNPVADVTVRGNKVVKPVDDGIDVSVSNGVIEDNKLVKAGDIGLRVDEQTSDSTFTGNKVKKSRDENLLDLAGDDAGNTFSGNKL